MFLSFSLLYLSLQRVDSSLKDTTPWLVLAGSGPAADLIAGIMRDVSTPMTPPVSPTLPPADKETSTSNSAELRDRMRERIKKHFPFQTKLDKLVDQVTNQSKIKRFKLRLIYGLKYGTLVKERCLFAFYFRLFFSRLLVFVKTKIWSLCIMETRKAKMSLTLLFLKLL